MPYCKLDSWLERVQFDGAASHRILGLFNIVDCIAILVCFDHHVEPHRTVRDPDIDEPVIAFGRGCEIKGTKLNTEYTAFQVNAFQIHIHYSVG